ncbi:MAG: hypothetical protein OEV42_18085 [Deltaproteobacteria bacterium]|nr:hypothetical protein [Deltaproteobacteria bacterium]
MVPLDEYLFFNSSFVVTSQAMAHPESGRDLQWGINFIGMVRPEGVLAMAANVFQSTIELPVSGTIRMPVRSEKPEMLRTLFTGDKAIYQYPWTVAGEIDKGVPGILLDIGIDVNYSMAKGNIEFSGDKICIYSPPNQDWMLSDTNPQFKPIQAFTGAIEVPEADIVADMLIPFELGIDQLLFISRFEGISLENLGKLTGITGSGEGLLSHMPEQISHLGDELGKLELTSMSVAIDYRKLSDIDVTNISFSIGMPELNWQVWEDHFGINNINCQFRIDYPFQSAKTATDDPDLVRNINLKVFGEMEVEEIPFLVSADSAEGFSVYAEMGAGHVIPLGKVLDKYAPAIPAPSNLDVDVFRLGVAPGRSYSLALAMTQEPKPWKIPIGPRPLEVSNVSMFVEYTQGQGFRGSVSGAIEYGNVELNLTYVTPGNVVINSFIEKTSLGKIFDTFTNQAIALPDSFDLDLLNNYVNITKQGNNYSLELVTEVDKFGSLALQVQKIGSKWGGAFGLNMTQGKLSDIPGLKSLEVLEKHVQLSKLLLLVSSFDNPGFKFPNMAAFNNPNLSSSSIPMPQGSGVVAGLNVHTTWTLDTSRKDMKLLKSILGLDPELNVTVQVGEVPVDDTRLFMDFSTKLLGKYPLDAQFGFMLSKGRPEMFLAGQLKVKIQKKDVSFNMAMSLLSTGVFFAGSAVGTIKFGNLQVSNLALMLGINWGGIPSLGIACRINTSKFSSSIALLFDSTSPDKSVLAGSISQLSLADITRQIAKVKKVPREVSKVFKTVKLRSIRYFTLDATVAKSLDAKDHPAVSAAFAAVGVAIPSDEATLLIVVQKAGNTWSVTDMANGMRHYTLSSGDEGISAAVAPQIYLAPAGARMGELTFTQGYFLSGVLQIMGQGWATQVEISHRKGIAATSYMDKPLQIGSKEFFRFSDYGGKKGPMISLSSFKQSDHEIEAFRKPHFGLSGRLRLLGNEAAALATVTSSGVTVVVEAENNLDLNYVFITGAYDFDWKLEGALNSATDIYFGGYINFKLNAKFHLNKLLNVKTDLGKVAVNAVIKMDTDMGYQNNRVYLEMDGQFRFCGVSYSIDLEVGAKDARIEKMGELVLNEVKKVIKSLYNTADEWVDALEDGLLEIGDTAENVGKALKNGYKQSAEQSAKLLKDAGRTGEKIGATIKSGFGKGAQDTAKIMKSAGISSGDIGKAMKSAYRQSAAQSAKLLKNAGFNSSDVSRMMKGTYGSASRDIAKALKGLGYSANTVANVMKNISKVKISVITSNLKYARYGVDDVGKGLRSIGQSDEAIGKLLKGAGYAIKDVSRLFKNTFKIDSETAAKYLRRAAFDSDDIAKMLRAGDLWDRSHKGVAKCLKKAGYGKKTAKKAMKAAGISKKKINDAFSWLKW